jgi:hypothetical protein
MNDNFKAEKVSKTASFSLNANIGKAFLLFGAFEERKWADGWTPLLIYPSTEIIEEGTTFKTPGNGQNETEFLWRVSKYEPQNYLIQYLVSTENRYWTITVKCQPLPDSSTYTTVTYTFIGLNNLGNEINKKSLDKMYSKNLRDWQEEINYFIANKKILKHVNDK